MICQFQSRVSTSQATIHRRKRSLSGADYSKMTRREANVKYDHHSPKDIVYKRICMGSSSLPALFATFMEADEAKAAKHRDTEMPSLTVR